RRPDRGPLPQQPSRLRADVVCPGGDVDRRCDPPAPHQRGGMMDKPVLALTRRWAAGSARRLLPSAAAENMRQLIQLRWIAVGGQLFTILSVSLGLSVQLPLAPMIALVALLAFANL